jgi:hypothetical protein
MRNSICKEKAESPTHLALSHEYVEDGMGRGRGEGGSTKMRDRGRKGRGRNGSRIADRASLLAGLLT